MAVRFRLTSFRTIIFSFGKKPYLLYRTSNLECQTTSFHKSIIFDNKPDLAEESKEETDSDSEHNSQRDNSANLKLKILHAGLNFVAEHGWSKNSIALGAKSLGLSPASHSLIEDGGADLVHYFNFMCNENLELHLEEEKSKNPEKKDIHEFVENALENRLRMVIPFAARWSEAMALMVSPKQIPSDLKNLLDLADIIWAHSGSNSLNVTWYSKRILLALSYKLCELSLVQDKSTEFADTFDFLQQRVEMVMTGDQFLNQVVATNQLLPHYGTAALITIRNMLGLSRHYK